MVDEGLPVRVGTPRVLVETDGAADAGLRECGGERNLRGC